MNKKMKTLLALFFMFLASVILHNVLYAFLGFEEPVFFLLSLLFLGVLAVYSVYVFYFLIRKLFRARKGR